MFQVGGNWFITLTTSMLPLKSVNFLQKLRVYLRNHLRRIFYKLTIQIQLMLVNVRNKRNQPPSYDLNNNFVNINPIF